MRMHRVLIGLLCLVSFVLSSCNTGNGVTTEASLHAMLRIVNVIPDASGPFDITFDGTSFVSGLGFEGLTPYQQVNTGSREIKVSIAGSSSNTIDTTLNLTGEKVYTYVIYGPVATATAILVDDATSDPGAGKFNLRVVNAAAGIAAVDVYVTAPGASLDTASPSVAGVALGTGSAFSNLPAGNAEIRVTPANSKQVIYDSAAQNIAERANLEAVVYTRGSSALVNVVMLNMGGAGTGAVNNNLLAQFKMINGSLVPSPLNVFVDQSLVLSNIPYTGASSYQLTGAGARTLTVEAAATPGATLLTIAPTLAPASDTSIVVTGPAGALSALVLSDNNLPPAASRARVRLVNSSADVAAFDVFANFSKQVSGLAMNSASANIEFDADPTTGTSYEFDFNLAGTTQVSLKLASVILAGGKTYTIYIVGPSTSLAGIVTQDN